MLSGRNDSDDRRLDLILGRLLQVGVILAGAVVLAGGILYLSKYGGRLTDFKMFQGEPIGLRRVNEIIFGAGRLSSRSVIQFGLLLLIATPIARVLLSVFAFARQRDYTYVTVTLIVLVLLIFSLAVGGW